ncbi:group 1 glycosyl transferase [Calothrix sp. NIES-2100]|uniref:glycosyltransferase family 4 protein n=1 Tax=Calothrix sp. NIES-2100 TaxID=1954172 RepID=UPI000B5E3713|nr:group 1 glycosyl transferase [Calothrix sp. NIES-2100]
MNKPKVLHIVGDKKIGGVRSCLHTSIASRELNQWDFLVLPMTEAPSVVKTWKPDLIVIHYACTWSQLPQLLAYSQTSKILIHEHNYSEGFTQTVPSRKRFELLLKLSYGVSNQVVAVSQAQGQWMLEKQLVSPQKLTVIQQCPLLDNFLTVTPKLIDRPLILGAYGRFCVQKGFDVLLQAIKLIPDVPIQLYIGGEGPDESELKQLAQGLDNVKFVGRIDDVPAFLQTCDVVVIPSRWEPWGNVFREAKAAAKPVIASQVDGLVEQMTDCGLLVPPDNPEKLAQAIASLITLPQTQLETWGKNGRESVKDAWKEYLSKWKTLLSEITYLDGRNQEKKLVEISK